MDIYLVDVYRGAPEVVELLVVVPHTNLTKVTIMVFLEIKVSISGWTRLQMVYRRWETCIHVGTVAAQRLWSVKKDILRGVSS